MNGCYCPRRSQEYYTIHDAVSPKWLTCIMMSRTRAGVKIRRRAIYVQRPAKAMADQEDHITEDETLPHHGEHSNLELHAVAVTVVKAVASSMQEALQPLLWLIPSALATPPPTAITGDKSKKAPSPDDTPGTSGKCLLSRRRSELAQYLSGREFTGSDTQPSSRQNMTMAVTYQNRACGSQSLSQAVAVSHQRQAATISHWSQAATISHRSQAADSQPPEPGCDSQPTEPDCGSQPPEPGCDSQTPRQTSAVSQLWQSPLTDYTLSSLECN